MSTLRSNLVGERFGRLTVVSFAGKTADNARVNLWLCRCDLFQGAPA